MPTITTAAGPLHYREWGRGTPLLLLHANPGDSRDFEAVALPLAQRHRVLALDWPGYGQSSPPPAAAAMTVLHLYDALQAFMAAMQLPPVLIIGNSVGGNVAARLAAQHPDAVRGLVLVAPGGFTPHNMLTRGFCALQGSKLALSPRRFAGLYLHVKNDTTARMLARAAGEQSEPEPQTVNRALWRSFGRPESDLRQLARQVKAPTLLMFGQRDLAIPARRDGAVVRACIPHARFVTLPSGHAPFAELPEAFLAQVEPFLHGI